MATSLLIDVTATPLNVTDAMADDVIELFETDTINPLLELLPTVNDIVTVLGVLPVLLIVDALKAIAILYCS